MSRNKIPEIGLVLFSILWIFIIGIDYLNKHPWYEISIQYFKFPRLVTFVLIFSVVLTLSYRFVPILKRAICTGPGLFFLSLVFLVALGVSFGKYGIGREPSTSELASYVLMSLKSMFFLIALSISAYLYGSIFNLKILAHPIYKVAVGLILICLLLFGMAALSQFTIGGTLIVLFLPLLLSYKRIIPATKGLLIKEWTFKDLNLVGALCIHFLIFYTALNFAYVQAPFPIGFDARNFYMNISQQLALSEGLIYGYRPYNWSLLIAMGFVLFDDAPVALSISLYGYLLTLFAMYQLGTQRLRLGTNKVLFGMLFFTVTPAVSNQLFIELKTDMALLFFQLIAISLFLKYINTASFKAVLDQKVGIKSIDKNKFLGPVAVLGIIVGFGMGIKLTNMFMLFSLIICFFWIMNESFVLTTAVINLTLGLFVLVGLDNISGIRDYHLGLDYLTGVFFLSGFSLLGYALYKDFKSIAPTLVIVITMGLFSTMSLFPWVLKNYSETRSLNPSVLLNGGTPGPDLNIYILNQNYLNSKE